MSADAFHITSPDMTGPYRGMRNALRDAKVNPDEIQYVNAHGTSTVHGRPQRDRRHQARLRRRRTQARGQLDQVDDRAPAGRGRRHRGGLHHASRSTTRSRRRRSTSSTRIRSATWTTAPTRRGRCRSTSRYPTRSASAAPTAPWSSASSPEATPRRAGHVPSPRRRCRRPRTARPRLTALVGLLMTAALVLAAVEQFRARSRAGAAGCRSALRVAAAAWCVAGCCRRLGGAAGRLRLQVTPDGSVGRRSSATAGTSGGRLPS